MRPKSKTFENFKELKKKYEHLFGYVWKLPKSRKNITFTLKL